MKFACLAVAAMLMAFGYSLVAHAFRFDDFIVAGDQFVRKSAVPVDIAVRPNSVGYDGQFYFRLALTPDTRAQTDVGITLDKPAWRMQRIGYPVLVHVLAFGRPALIPCMMVLVNIAGFLALAWFAVRIAVQRDLPAWFVVAVIVWPGYVVTLQRDTTEILSVAFMAGAISALLARRYGTYCLLAVAATLTRETPILVFGAVLGVFGLDLVRDTIARAAIAPDKLRRTALALVALLPFFAWRHELALRWGASPAQTAGGFIGWPFVGIYQKLAECLAGTFVYSPRVIPNRIDTVLVFVTLCVFVATVGLVAARLCKVRWKDADMAALALGWVLVALMHACLTSLHNGPWVDMIGYLRGCTEFWFLSMLLLAGSGLRLPRGGGTAALALAAVVLVKQIV